MVVGFRYRQGETTLQDIQTINEAYFGKEPRAESQVATFGNKERDSINTAMFHAWTTANAPSDGSLLDDAIIIFMDELQMLTQKGNYVHMESNSAMKNFYQNVGEYEVNAKSENDTSRYDPMLKLYLNCPVMLTENKDVLRGQANGSRVIVKHVKLKIRETTFPVILDNVLHC